MAIKYVAFLRAVNVGGRVIKMQELKKQFEALKFSNVETFIASGNVIFDSPATDTAALERRIDEHLRAALGYRAEAFLRTTAELAEIAAYQPFPAAELNADGASLYVAFLPAPLSNDARERVMALRTELDDFHLHGRELYWLIRGKMSDSTITPTSLGKAIGAPTTTRNINTIQRIAAKYPAP
jgi:uncharacterized protein (DUF1697 family)